MEGFKPTLALVKMVDSENPNLMNHTEHEIMVRNSSLLLFLGGAAATDRFDDRTGWFGKWEKITFCDGLGGEG